MRRDDSDVAARGALDATEEFDRNVLRHLEKQARSLPLGRLAGDLGESRSRVAAALLRLQRQRVVRRTSRSEWVARSIATPELCIEGGPNPGAMRSADVSQQTESTAAAVNDSRWSDFRRLCLAYAECVRLEERGSLEAYADREGAQFIVIDTPLNWRAVAAGTPLTVAARPEWAGFLAGITARREIVDLVLGAPVDLFVGKDRKSGDEYRVVSPVFVSRVVVRRAGSKLEIHASGQIEVNHRWLSRRLPREEQRREFIETMGLAMKVPRDQDSEEYWGVSTFDEAVERLFELRRKWWQEFAQLDRPTGSPSFPDLESSGLYNRVLLLKPPELKYHAGLHRELLRIAREAPDEDLDGTALRHVFPHAVPPTIGVITEEHATETVSRREGLDGIAEYQLLNEDQRAACHAALSEPLTVVTGPPGTGKSLVVAHVLCNVALRGDAALFASRNHQALEAVEPRLNALTEPRPIMLRPTRPFGQTAERFDWFRMMTDLLAKPRAPGAGERFICARDAVDRLLVARAESESRMNRIAKIRSRLAEVQKEIRECSARCPASWREHARRNHGSAGSLSPTRIRKVIACLKALGEAPRTCTARVRRWIMAPLWTRRLSTRVLALTTHPAVAALQIDRRQDRDFLTDPDGAPRVLANLLAFHELSEAHRKEHAERSRIEEYPAVDDSSEQLAAVNERLRDATQSALNALAEAASGADLPPERRAQFANLRAALKNRPQDLQQSPDLSPFARAFRDAAPDLMRHYPLWAVSNLSAARALPLQSSLFDLVVIDEASQCDIPSVVPLLFRARRALIVGDPNQLSHVTQLPRDTEMRVREAFDVDDYERFERFTFRANSAYDVAANGAMRVAVTLRSHYRSVGPIIDYCNAAFYSGTLVVRTDEAELRRRLAAAHTRAGVVWTHLESDVQPAASGCHSPDQVSAVETELRRLQAVDFPGTVGVVTPFRAQATRIRDRCHQVFDSAVRQEWHLIVDTVDGFQGDERDLVLMSLVGGAGMPQGSRQFLANNPNRFNVAVSRARAVLHVIGDRQWAGASGIPFLTTLAQAAESPDDGATGRRNDLIGPVWEPRLADALRRAGLSFDQQYPTCGYYLDFALFGPTGKICVEVDGEAYHRDSSGDRLLDDLYRDTILMAAGWKVLRFWVYELREDMDGCVARIQRAHDAD